MTSMFPSLMQAVVLAAAAPDEVVAAPPAPPATVAEASSAAEPEERSIEGRKRPGAAPAELPAQVTQKNIGAVLAPPPEAFPTDEFPIPDRWRLAKALCPDKNFVGVQAICHSHFDPYHQNYLKGDRPIPIDKKPGWLPIHGDDWFFVLSGISDTILEPRSFPTPASRQVVERPGQNGVFGRQESLVAAQTFIVSTALIKGSTAYKPPDIEYRLTLAYNINYANVQERRVLFVEPSKKTQRYDAWLGVQELFIDKHLGNRSDRYDFDSLRVGIQPFQSDFRGFLFNDNNLGVRLFGNRDNNRYQYNVAAIWRLEKDTNSGLNDVTRKPRDDYILFGNLFVQDFPIAGMTSLVSATANINRETDIKIDDNGFPIVPVLLGDLKSRKYEAYYAGYSVDGRLNRFALSASVYGVLGRDSHNLFTGKEAKIRGVFGAAELSYDIDWIRLKFSALYASGDKRPYDNTETGFDSILENPIFAGADTSYWIRQSIPFAGGGRVVSINQRNGILNDLRSSKDQGQSNFNNPGTMLLGAGADLDVLPQLRVSPQLNHLWFQNTQTLQALRHEGSIPRSIGWDLSTALVYRPSMVQNAVFRLSGAILQPGRGLKDLVTNSKGDKRYYSVLFNGILTF
jgi:hypothetical protein